MQKLWHFIISLPLLNIYTWNSKYMVTIKRGLCTNKWDSSKLIFAKIMPLFRLRIFIEKAATAKHWHPHVVFLFLSFFRRLFRLGNLNPLLHRYSFWRVNNRQLLKTFCKKEKLLVISHFSFFLNFFTQSDNCISICSYFLHHIFICCWIARS